jgi:hypothetical protein
MAESDSTDLKHVPVIRAVLKNPPAPDAEPAALRKAMYAGMVRKGRGLAESWYPTEKGQQVLQRWADEKEESDEQ